MAGTHNPNISAAPTMEHWSFKVIATVPRDHDVSPLTRKEIKRWRKHWLNKLYMLRRAQTTMIGHVSEEDMEALRKAIRLAERKYEYWVLRDARA